MALFEFSSNGLTEVKIETMVNLKIRERQDIQDVLRTNINAVAPGVLIVAEEYTGWVDSQRRIDLLGIDTGGALVVLELKRTTDGGHMELQAIRYAAMVSALGFDDVVEIFDEFLRKHERNENARELIHSHVEGSEDEVEAAVGGDVRIVLVSQDFGKEITTAVLWLNEQGLDIRCVRLHPYSFGDRIIFDIQEVLPLPSARDYIVRKQMKVAGQKAAKSRGARDFTKYRVSIDGKAGEELGKGRAILAVVHALLKAGVSPAEMDKTINQPRRLRFYQVDGEMNSEESFLAAAEHAAALNGGKPFSEPRYFTADDELLRHGGKTYAFSNQWGRWTVAKMKDLIEAHGGGHVAFEAVE